MQDMGARRETIVKNTNDLMYGTRVRRCGIAISGESIRAFKEKRNRRIVVMSGGKLSGIIPIVSPRDEDG